MKGINDWYTRSFNAAMGDAGNIDAVKMEADARKIFAKHGVPKEVVDGLILYEKRRLGIS